MLTLDACLIDNGGFRLTANLTVAPGVNHAVIGPSGAGKSTLLGAIAGFVPLASGAIRWDGTDISDLRPGERPVAMLFQDGNLFAHLSIAQNVGLGLDPNLKLTATQKDRIADALDRVGLAGLENRRPAALSGGQQSRAALARILVQSRPLILLDEPFAALGPALKRDMLDLVAELAHETGATLMMVSHDPSDAKRLAPRTILVADGEAHTAQDTGSLLKSPPPALRDYLG